MSLKDKIIKVATIPAISGGCAAVATSLIMGVSFNDKSPLPIIGVRLPSPVVEGISCGVASMGAEVFSDFMLPHITGDDKLARTERLVLKPIATGTALAGLAWVNSSSPSIEVLGKHFLVGSGSEIAANYVYRTAKQMLSQ